MKAMSNVDLYAISHELNELLSDARVQKAYQPTRDTVIIRFHVPGKGRVDVAFQAGLRVHTTQYPPENPKVPPSFPMLLRKHLKNATVKGVRQHNFDRILEIDIQKEHRFTLVVELFSQGNIILLDEENRIILPLKHRHAQGRKITSKEEYHYPPERGIHPLNVELDELKELFKDSDSDLIRALARSGLGGMYSEEIILRSGVDKKQPANQVSDQEIESIHQSMVELFKPLKTFQFQPQIVREVIEEEEDNTSAQSPKTTVDKKETEKTTQLDESQDKTSEKTDKTSENEEEINSLKTTNEPENTVKTSDKTDVKKVKTGKEDVLPLDILTYQNYQKERFDTFNQAADEFYSGKVGAGIKKVQEDVWAKEVGKYEKRLRIQEETLEKFQKTIVETKKKGNLLYSYYSEIQNLLDIIHQAREKFSWMEIASKFKKARKEGMKEAQIIESMDKMGVLTLNLEGERVIVDANLEIPENAEKYYNKGKKAKRKIKGVNIAIERTRKDVERKRNKRELALERVKVPQKRVRRELKWFEKLRWFLSSDGLLVIGGRDAGTNELVVKRYLDNQDIYLHSDIHGAPSVVIKKGEMEEIPESSIMEAGSLAASFSSAWSKGYASQDVYWVHPDQVSKTPQSGEFVARGAFIIRGSRKYLRGIPLKIAVGIVDYEGERIMAGPVESVSKYTDNYVVLKPGFTKKEEIARSVLKKIDPERILTLEDVIRVLPSGKCDFEDKRRR